MGTASKVEQVQLEGHHTAVVRGHPRPEQIAGFLEAAFGQVMQALAAQGLFPSGPPFARYEPTETGPGLEAGFPVPHPLAPSGRVEPSQLPGGPALTTTHMGPYQTLGQAYQALERWLGDHNTVMTSPPWECYLDAPGAPEPRTVVYAPYRPGQPDPR